MKLSGYVFCDGNKGTKLFDAFLFNLRPPWGVGWGGVDATPSPPRSFYFAVRHIFEARGLMFALAAFVTFCKVRRRFQVSVTFGSSDMTLLSRSCRDPTDRFILSCASSVSGA